MSFQHSFKDWVILENLLIFVCSHASAKNRMHFSLHGISQLCQKVRHELDRMLSLGVILKVDNPTPWCAGMVVAPKKNGDISGYVWISGLLIAVF